MMRTPSTTGEPLAWEEQAPLVAQDPPPWFVRALAWLLISLFFTVLLASIVVRVPETVESRFALVSETGADPIEAPRQAVLEEVLVRPGQTVQKGQKLFVMRVDEVREWQTETDARQQALRAMGESSQKLEEAHASALRIKDGEIDQAQRETQFREKYLRTLRDLVAKLEKLAATGLISEIELTSQRLSLAQAEKDLEVARRAQAQRRLERQGMVTERRRQRIAEKSAAEDLSIRIAALNQPLLASVNGMLEIRAPYDAVCVSITKQNSGSVVAPGEQLAQLSPLSNRLQARLEVPETGLSRLEPGQPVRLFFDAFPYQRYGVVNGAIDWISPAAVTREQGSDFVAVASLRQSDIVVDNAPYPLRAGMKGQARVTVGRRALIEYAFEPIRRLRENLTP